MGVTSPSDRFGRNTAAPPLPALPEGDGGERGTTLAWSLPAGHTQMNSHLGKRLPAAAQATHSSSHGMALLHSQGRALALQ